MTSYYNEIDKYAAQWLRNLIDAGEIAPGVVDERSIEDVRPSDLRGFKQCHFFAGIGVWSYALRRAGWPDDRPIWTGSCPCQPFSAAGKGLAFADERHLWPYWHFLISKCLPPAILGEQVASKDADPWIDLVQADMEGLGYAFGAVPFPSAGVGAPHIRDRLYWVANANGVSRRQGGALHRWRDQGGNAGARARSGRNGVSDLVADHDHIGRLAVPRLRQPSSQHDAEPCDGAGGMANSHGERSQGCERGRQRADAQLAPAERDGEAGGLAHASGGFDVASSTRASQRGLPPRNGGGQGHPATGPTNGLWRDADWIFCRDGKWRPVEPGTFPLVDGSAGRMGRVRADQERIAALVPRKDQGNRAGRLRGYGNAINAEAAIAFIEASGVMG